MTDSSRFFRRYWAIASLLAIACYFAAFPPSPTITAERVEKPKRQKSIMERGYPFTAGVKR